MEEKVNYPTQLQQPGMHYPPPATSNQIQHLLREHPNALMHPQNSMNQMSVPQSYDQATMPYHQPR